MGGKQSSGVIKVLLADDDADDRYFFDRALKELPVKTELTTVVDGEKLMTYLVNNVSNLPDVLFLDQNMPCKNGVECIAEIKQNSSLRDFPVIVYSTHLDERTADLFYQNGAYFYIRKTEFPELKQLLFRVLTLISENKFTQLPRDQFMSSVLGDKF